MVLIKCVVQHMDTESQSGQFKFINLEIRDMHSKNVHVCVLIIQNTYVSNAPSVVMTFETKKWNVCFSKVSLML